jgi:nickel-type superoxide dismutase maturation protease
VLLKTIAPIPAPGTRQDVGMAVLTRIRVVGPSMEPLVRNGEWWVVRRTRRHREGDVALIVHPRRPDALIVKRLAQRRADGWWVLGDNPDASEDSRQFGSVPDDLVIGSLVFRYRPLWRSA